MKRYFVWLLLLAMVLAGCGKEPEETVVDGVTVYYPIVNVGASDSAGKPYSSGKIYCFSPAFTAINANSSRALLTSVNILA